MSLNYVGMDVHKETISIAVFRDYDAVPFSEIVIPNNPGRIRKYFSNLQIAGDATISCYEAGPTGFALYRQLEEMEIPCVVVAPTKLPQKPGGSNQNGQKGCGTSGKRLLRGG